MLDLDSLKQNLLKSFLFRDISPLEAERIIAAGQCLTFEKDRYVYKQDDNNRNFYIVADGDVELSLNVNGGDQFVVSHIGPGGHFGETSLLTNSSNSLNALALTDLHLLCFDAATFNSVLFANSHIQHQLSVALAKRLRISFHDHANALTKTKKIRAEIAHNLDPSFFSELQSTVATQKSSFDTSREARLSESTIARQGLKAVKLFSNNLAPALLSGEAGTGRRMVAYEIHQASAYKNGPYTELDILNIAPLELEGELFGYTEGSFPFGQINQHGLFDRFRGGTVVLYNIEHMEPDCFRKSRRIPSNHPHLQGFSQPGRRP